MASPLPLFPLSVVLLPATPMPLHIFEERYKAMFSRLLPENGEFGIVLAKDDGIMNIGCSAKIDRVLKRYEDGRLDLIAVGQRRFRILDLDKNQEVLQADIEFFNDVEALEIPPTLRRTAMDLCTRLREVEVPNLLIEPALDAPQVSFQLAQFISDLDKRQTILTMQSETERLQYLVSILPEYISTRERIVLARRVAPLNGHAKLAKGE
jgi:ATP-dependent Lon protease